MQYGDVVRAMHRLELLRRIKARAIFASSGLHPGQLPLLRFIQDHPGCTQKEAADELDVTPASAAASLKRLEKSGYVSRRMDSRDSRRNQLSLTPAGEESLRAGDRAFDGLDAEMLKGLSEAEIAQFRHTCEKMFDNLSDESTRNLTIYRLHRAAYESVIEKEER